MYSKLSTEKLNPVFFASQKENSGRGRGCYRRTATSQYKQKRIRQTNSTTSAEQKSRNCFLNGQIRGTNRPRGCPPRKEAGAGGAEEQLVPGMSRADGLVEEQRVLRGVPHFFYRDKFGAVWDACLAVPAQQHHDHHGQGFR